MSRLKFSPATFTVTFCCVYIVVFAANLPLFLYYPLHGDFAWGHQELTDAGPAMAWYGLMASALIPAVPAAFVVPERVMDGRLRNRLWLFPLATMLACVFLLRIFFV